MSTSINRLKRYYKCMSVVKHPLLCLFLNL